MLTRPTDPSGDILPVLSSSDLLSGPEAAAVALRDHLNLFTGDWWETESQGNAQKTYTSTCKDGCSATAEHQPERT